MSDIDDVIDTLDLRSHSGIVAGMISRGRAELAQLRTFNQWQSERIAELEAELKQYHTAMNDEQGLIDHLSKRLDIAQHTIARQDEQLQGLQIPCEKCHGSGFSYDNVCDCTGGYIGYATPEVVQQLSDSIIQARNLLAICSGALPEWKFCLVYKVEEWLRANPAEGIQDHLPGDERILPPMSETGTIEYCIKYAMRHGCMVTSEAAAELVSLRGEVLQWQQMCVTADGLRDTIEEQAEEMKNVRDLIDRQLNAGYISFTDRVEDMRRWLDTHPEVR